MRNLKKILIFLLASFLLFSGCGPAAPGNETATTARIEESRDPSREEEETSPESSSETVGTTAKTTAPETETTVPETEQAAGTETDIPAYAGEPYAVLNDNIPLFSEEQLTEEAYESYGELDGLGRCTAAVSCIGPELMPTEERGEIGQVKPTGWHTVKYDFVDGKYLYNRCHLIGYQLTGENANEKNLITGTRYLNVEGMLPFENMVADYIKETGNHVLYRVTPVFSGDDLLAQGVRMEARSVEDSGAGILFHVFCYNVQPGVSINYADGRSSQDENGTAAAGGTEASGGTLYVLNTNTKKFHYPSCSSVSSMKDSNRQDYTGSRDDLIREGYSPCGRCNP